MKIEELKEGQKILVECEFDSLAGGNQAWVLIQGEGELVQLDSIKLDQPKPVVPQMIFDVIESFDDDVDYLHEHMSRQSDEVREWLTHNERDFYEAWLAYPNITVQKEKLYQIIDKRLDVTFNCLGYVIEDGVWFWANKKAFLSNENVRLDHTQQQLIDAGFEEVFENPNYEAKEVTE